MITILIKAYCVYQEITNSRKFMEKIGILNVYKLNLYQFLNFMLRAHKETIPKSFQSKFQYIEHKYENRQNKDNFIIPKRNTGITRFAISSRGPRIWNSLTNIQLRPQIFILYVKAP